MSDGADFNWTMNHVKAFLIIRCNLNSLRQMLIIRPWVYISTIRPLFSILVKQRIVPNNLGRVNWLDIIFNSIRWVRLLLFGLEFILILYDSFSWPKLLGLGQIRCPQIGVIFQHPPDRTKSEPGHVFAAISDAIYPYPNTSLDSLSAEGWPYK